MEKIKNLIRKEELECKTKLITLLRDKGINLPENAEENLNFFEIFSIATSEGISLPTLQIIQKFLQNLCDLQKSYSETIPYFKGLYKKLSSINDDIGQFSNKNVKYLGLVYKMSENIFLTDAYLKVKDDFILEDMPYVTIDPKTRVARIFCINLVKDFPQCFDIS